ncbi:GIY-YIG nuclease family protein [Photobacterium carnosum]|uniref:GIY-YIG nuclease family protein n=1 Tax=Photobacterium carnosum TaxID=2023717 RepID=UPI001E4D801E|nr:GIY-YIG nuclease family protein [Photobacterium carnosum]MCD9530358.1 GIY-YIG nuclease family protein [Photobacterium carnosum]MCF2154448.1 GIY-YIG nuclease family protein [Photobacterium carnosum]MCF2216208.1 GIY-YIG nuclease family protein [Photobacterium carnosum]
MIRLRFSKAVERINLDDIFSEEDDLGLLDVTPLKIKAPAGNILANQFEEVSNFYEINGHLPSIDAQAFDEKRLARRLKAFQFNPEQCKALKQYDAYGLLKCETIIQASELGVEVIHQPLPVEPDKSELVTSLDDIFDDDDDDLLDFDAPELFTMHHVPVERKEQPDEIAKRQPCTNFHRYLPIFDTVQQELKSGSSSLDRFRHELNIHVGDAFILNGVMGYVHSAGERLEGYSTYNARLHLIFENGTEMHMLFQSLTHGLVRDEQGSKVVREGLALVPDDTPIPTGLVYVLATKSTDSVLAEYKSNLYKVGFTDGTVDERIKYADKDKTFLEAPVRVVMTTECYNIDAHKLETLIHGFLGHRRLNITIEGHAGQTYSPKEWFHVPLNTIVEVIKYILDGTISLYRMDNTTGRVVKKKLNK